MTPPHQVLAEAIHQLTHPPVGQPPVDQDLILKVQELQKDLLSKSPIEEKHRRLQSVVSRLEHTNKQIGKAQEEESKYREKLNTVIEERNQLVKKAEALEQERQELLKVVHNPEADPGTSFQRDDDMENPEESGTESQHSTEPRAPASKKPKHQQRRVPTQRSFCAAPPPTLQPTPLQWAGDVARMDPDSLKHLLSVVQQETSRREHILNAHDENPAAGFGLITPEAF
jgi:myosin heavy subunit